jgi:hypothetical protein
LIVEISPHYRHECKPDDRKEIETLIKQYFNANSCERSATVARTGFCVLSNFGSVAVVWSQK